MSNILFIGLGVMGSPMAGHLVSAGHTLTVTNRSVGKIDSWLNKYSGTALPDPVPADLEIDAVILCVGNDNDVREKQPASAQSAAMSSASVADVVE